MTDHENTVRDFTQVINWAKGRLTKEYLGAPSPALLDDCAEAVIRLSEELQQATLFIHSCEEDNRQQSQALKEAEEVIKSWVDCIGAFDQISGKQDPHPWLGSAKEWLAKYGSKP